MTVDSLSFHSKYKKRFKVSKKFFADPGEHELHEGDLVMIGECRPLSKKKNFKVVEILKRAAEVDELTEEEDTEKAMHREKVAPIVEEKKKEESTEEAEESSPEES